LLSSLILSTFFIIPADLQVPEDWYTSTTRLFEFCVEAQFEHPMCPQISQVPGIERKHPDIAIPEPSGDLTTENLFNANLLYQLKRPPYSWLVKLNLSEKMAKESDERLWAEAQYLYARVLFDQRKYKEADTVFDRIVDTFKGKALFHQQRGWSQFFSGKLDRALGSIVSAESPLIYSIPYFEKYFLRALVERESCQWSKAFDTVSKGREFLKTAKADASAQPWVVLCDRKNLGETCQKLRAFYDGYYKDEIRKALNDLDLVELEMRDRGVTKPQKKSDSPIVWPFVGEAWSDELGFYSVPVRAQCG